MVTAIELERLVGDPGPADPVRADDLQEVDILDACLFSFNGRRSGSVSAPAVSSALNRSRASSFGRLFTRTLAKNRAAVMRSCLRHRRSTG